MFAQDRPDGKCVFSRKKMATDEISAWTDNASSCEGFLFLRFLCFLISCIVSRLLGLANIWLCIEAANKKWIASPKLSHYAIRPLMTHSLMADSVILIVLCVFFSFPEVISLSKNIFVCRMLNVTGKSYWRITPNWCYGNRHVTQHCKR